MAVWSKEELINLRRELHQIPEIGLEEYKTHEYLLKVIRSLPQERLEIKTWETSIVVKVKGRNAQKIMAWRTDIDGLPIVEETGCEFASKHEGRMHACGHDLHMTMALGLLQRVCEAEFDNDMVFIFQAAEENEAGGKILYDSGTLNEWMPDEIYAMHVQPNLPVGTVSTHVGTLFAGTCEFHVDFKGKGGHAAYPHDSNDMIVAATQFVQQAQTIVSRNVNPAEGAVVTIGAFHAGTTNNIIAEEAHLEGTMRTLTNELNELTMKRMTEICKGIEMSFQCEIELKLLPKGYSPVENHPKETKDLIAFMKNYDSVNFVESVPAMTGEDFGYFLSKIPGAMFWFGVEAEYGLHHSKMNPNEEAIPLGVNMLLDFFSYLDKK